ncbi:MAG: alpha-glucan family phosphorylase [Hyphomicrobiales bacterium]
MSQDNKLSPDYLFEVSWEICNKVGGIYTVLSTKALSIKEKLGKKYVLIGPDVWKETSQNPDFIEDNSIFKNWRLLAEDEGLMVRIGRWRIVGEPIVILVDFTSYFAEKDKIFAHFWEKYKLDSISGQWDYIEPGLFGYAAAKVIESFYNYKLTASDKLIAHFHEWMTGTGILYLKEKVPQAGTVFTTHATVLGRSIAGNMLPLYDRMNSYSPDNSANQFGVTSKYSLEKLSAHHADCFTTVSDITNNECKHFLEKPVDVVTENGFEDDFVPQFDDFDEKRAEARGSLLRVARSLLNQDVPDDSILVINSGRYEFYNKGIDVFIEALGKLNQEKTCSRNLVAFITVPGHQTGINNDLIKRLNQTDYSKPMEDVFLTHNLFDEDNDPCLKAIKQANLHNSKDDNVKIIFVPAYLNGDDGIFNVDYYDLLIGFDLSVFPSYYEPWGYTPLESIAFNIPTITTTLAGFGMWVNANYEQKYGAVKVIPRGDADKNLVADEITHCLMDFCKLDPDGVKATRQEAREISELALWDHLIFKYWNAYDIALDKSSNRYEQYKHKHILPTHLRIYRSYKQTEPSWKKISIHPRIPKKLKALMDMSNNLWWSWNTEAEELFEMIDPSLWIKSQRNPKKMLESLNYEQLSHLANDDIFIQRLNIVERRFTAYLDDAKQKKGPKIAYFSMEYGLHDSIKIYSGGLGMLAGDYLKQASDSNVNMVGVGLIYRYGYFQQQINHKGEQINTYPSQRSSHLPIVPVADDDNHWLSVQVALPGRVLHARVWLCHVGRISLYLLDTDCEENNERDRVITHQLYGGDNENRFIQELLLGVGGIRLLNVLGISPDIYHCNEGHAAFTGIERLREFIDNDKLSFNQALEIVRSTSLFTTHTPVPAGHDAFEENTLRTYIPHYAERLNLNWEQFMNLGRFTPNNKNEKFSMSVLATRLSQEVNGVSAIHGKVSREMFHSLYPGYYPAELHISHVTNAVHYPTWTAKEWKYVFHQKFGDEFIDNQDSEKHWKYLHKISDEAMWSVKRKLKLELFEYLHHKLHSSLTSRQESPKLILKTLENLNDRVLTICFARRFATYKRAYLLFSNLKRLEKIVNRKKRPVQFIFAGKAHPNDKAGQELIKKIIEISRRPEFLGKIIFLENYNMEMAKKLLHGVDIWLNTPTYPLEASGTSGMKAVMNGTLNLSVLDGWWAEGYTHDAGWAIKESEEDVNQEFQNELDAEILYNLIEDEVIPAFYYHNENGIPEQWIGYMRNSFTKIAPRFTMKRMLDEYYGKFYNKLYKRSVSLMADDNKKLNEIVRWKNEMRMTWEHLEVVDIVMSGDNGTHATLGDELSAEIKIKAPDVEPEDIHVEVIVGQGESGSVKEIKRTYQMDLVNSENDVLTFKSSVILEYAGDFRYAIRVYPYNKDLPHRMDFPLLKWV